MTVRSSSGVLESLRKLKKLPSFAASVDPFSSTGAGERERESCLGESLTDLKCIAVRTADGFDRGN